MKSQKYVDKKQNKLHMYKSIRALNILIVAEQTWKVSVKYILFYIFTLSMALSTNYPTKYRSF